MLHIFDRIPLFGPHTIYRFGSGLKSLIATIAKERMRVNLHSMERPDPPLEPEQLRGKLMIPPLRQHKPDIPALAHYFVEKKADELKLHHVPEIHPRSIDALIAYDWPGNVRELENSIERALIQSHGGRRPLNFDQVTVNPLQRPMEFLPAAGPQMPTLDEVNIRYIRQAKESEPCINQGQSNPEP